MENTLENNKIIAEFMGYEGQHEDLCGNNILDNDNFQGEIMRPFMPEKTWDDLMPVVEKIDIICQSLNDIQENMDGFIKKSVIDDELTYGKINPVYLAIVLFVEWYNTQDRVSLS